MTTPRDGDSMSLEEERKLAVPRAFALPELAACLPAGGTVVAREAATLTATYYDTRDLRLARAGATMRHRHGDAPPWTVKLPAGTPGIRREISRPGRPDAPPPELAALVTALTRGVGLGPVVTVRTQRQAYDLCDCHGSTLAELADDLVQVRDGDLVRDEFREIEVERRNGRAELLDRVQETLVAAGATAGEFTPKLVRALGQDATAPPDLPPPAPLPQPPRAGDVVTRAIRDAVARIVAHDPLLRLGQRLPDGDTPVHQLRVGCRRLRSDLRTFAPLVDPQWARRLRRQLRWLGRTLGAARDAEVLRERLHRTAGADPLAPCDAAAVARLDETLAARQQAVVAALPELLSGPAYLSLLDELVAAAAAPPLTPLAATAARETLPQLVAVPWQALRARVDGAPGQPGLSPHAPDAEWHAVRVLGKHARYAVETVAEVMGRPAPKLARRLARVQDLLGAHQDAAVAADTWLAIARAARSTTAEPTDDPYPLAITAGRLYERERAAVWQARTELPAAWRAATRPRMLSWLP